MDSKHTPGPWKVDPVAGFICAKTGIVAQTFNKFELDYQNADANARLMAAAPELLAALTLMVRDHATPYCRCSICECAQAAIAKATGQEVQP